MSLMIIESVKACVYSLNWSVAVLYWLVWLHGDSESTALSRPEPTSFSKKDCEWGRYRSRWLYLAFVTLSGRDEFLSLVGR